MKIIPDRGKDNLKIMVLKAIIIISVLFMTIFLSSGLCSSKCIGSTGEAAINNDDIPSAKTEAIARAKWAAVEQVAGVEVKAQSVVQNMVLVDDAISKQIRGIISSYKLIGEENRRDVMWVKINACVEPVKAREAASLLAMNNSVAVFIPTRKPRVVQEYGSTVSSGTRNIERHNILTSDEYDETNILSENLIGRIADAGYTVNDIAPTHAADAREIEKAIKGNSFLSVRSLMYKFLSNVLVIGKIDYTVSTRKGEDIGYGLSMPFNNVTVRLTYRIVTKEGPGKVKILAADFMEEKGMANNVEDATAKGLKALSEKFTPVVLDKLSLYIKEITKKVKVRVEGVTDLNSNFAVKDILQNIAWVTNVDEKGIGVFIVDYPENTVYLANSMGQKGFRIIDFSPREVDASYETRR